MSTQYDTGVATSSGGVSITLDQVMMVDPATGGTAASMARGTAFSAVENDVDVSVKASAGRLLSVVAFNYNAAKRYLQVHNKATAPAGGDTATLSFPIPAGSSASPGYVEIGANVFGPNGLYLSTGIAVGVSTAAATFTAATTTDHVTAGVYV